MSFVADGICLKSLTLLLVCTVLKVIIIRCKGIVEIIMKYIFWDVIPFVMMLGVECSVNCT
jgi:hypothetical protein